MKTCYSILNNSREFHYFSTYIGISPAGISVKITPEAILIWIEATQLTLDPDVIKFITQSLVETTYFHIFGFLQERRQPIFQVLTNKEKKKSKVSVIQELILSA